MENACAIEGFADFIGPMRPRFEFTKAYGGCDPRAMTSNFYAGNTRHGFWQDSMQAIDAPAYIAKGSTNGCSFENDPDRNVFPCVITRRG